MNLSRWLTLGFENTPVVSVRRKRPLWLMHIIFSIKRAQIGGTPCLTALNTMEAPSVGRNIETH